VRESLAGGGRPAQLYINFLTEDEGPDRIAAVLGTGLERLAAIKAKWDPHNVFRINRNIQPVQYRYARDAERQQRERCHAPVRSVPSGSSFANRERRSGTDRRQSQT
jgi:hypothetical protein